MNNEAGRPAGNPATSRLIASKPPADAPMTMISLFCWSFSSLAFDAGYIIYAAKIRPGGTNMLTVVCGIFSDTDLPHSCHKKPGISSPDATRKC